MAADKFRFRFRKVGDLRLLSHLDLTRCFERMLRRAALPFKSSAGFHPSPRMVFGLPLPLGCDGANEVFELELTAPLDGDDVLARLNAQTPNGLRFTSSRPLPMNATAMARRAEYTLPLPSERIEPVRTKAAELLAMEKVWVERLKPKPRRLNIRPYLRNIAIADAALLLDLWVTPYGTARADELLKLLGAADLPDAGAVLLRRTLEIHDETEPRDGTDRPPDGAPETAPWDHPPATAGDRDEPAATWGLSPNGPVVE